MSDSCREALPYVREWSRDPPSFLGVVGALPNVRELSGIPPKSLGGQPEVLGMVWTPSRMSLRGGKPFRMSGSCWVALLDVREAVPVVREWSGGPLGCPSVQKALPDVREALSDVRKCSGDRHRCLGVVGTPSRMSGSGRDFLPDVRGG